MRWSVGIEAEGDRVFSREEIVELADAVAASDGMASGIGTSRYGARLIVVADSRDGRHRDGDRGLRGGGENGRAAGRADRRDRGRQRGRGSQELR